jgi:hypothetical protein
MISRILWATAFASTAFLTFASEALAASDRTQVGVGMFLLAAGVMSILFVVFLVKYYFGYAGRVPPPVPDDGHNYPSLPADGAGHDAAPSHH